MPRYRSGRPSPYQLRREPRNVITVWVDKAEWEAAKARGAASGGFRPLFETIPVGGGVDTVRAHEWIEKRPRL